MCQPLCKLLGAELSCLGSDKKLPTAELLTTMTLDKKRKETTIGLLFAPDEDPAKGKSSSREQVEDLRDCLIELHGELGRRSDVSFEVVFIPMTQSSCPTESANEIEQLFSQAGSPFFKISSGEAAKIQEYLVRKYGVQDGCTLVLIDAASTDVLLFNGIEKALGDPKGLHFPWKYSTCSEILGSGQLLRNVEPETLLVSGGKKNLSSVALVDASSCRTPITGLLFAAFWCPPCRTFITNLVDIYKRVNKDETRLEIVYVSSDRSQDSFDKLFATMPWLAIPFEDEKRREVLTKAYNVKAIPNLTLVDDHDVIITMEGRLEVNDDVEGIEFPWHPRLVDELRDRHSATLNNSLCVIYFTDDSEMDYEKADVILTPIALEVVKSSVPEACEPKFFIAADSDLAESLRIFMDLDERRSYLVIMDAAGFRYAVEDLRAGSGSSEKSAREFLANFQSNKLTYKYIQSRFV